MDRLPVEILHRICARIRARKDILGFRRVCKIFAAIGAQHMLPQVPVAFLHQSFLRLKAISEHPVISQHVTAIIYQADVLPKIETFKEYRRWACMPHQPIAFSPRPQPDADEQVRQSYHKDLVKFINKPNQSSQEQIREGWKLYQSLYEDQDALLRSPIMDMQYFHETMAKFPRLTKLRVQTRRTYNEAGMYLINNPYKNTLVGVVLPDKNHFPCGVRPLHSLLLGALSSQTAFRELSVGLLSWRFFSSPESIFAVLKQCVRHLRKLDMEIPSCDYERPEADEQADWRACVKWFLTGRVRDFVAAAPDLEIIVLLFDALHDYDYAINLSSVLGNYTWPSLRLLNLRGIKAREDDLLSVFKRHAATLRVLILGDINLYGPKCSWMTVFLRIPEILDLSESQCHGNFITKPSMRLIKMDDLYHGDGYRLTFNLAVRQVLCRFFMVVDRILLKLDVDMDMVAERKYLLRRLFGEDEALD